MSETINIELPGDVRDVVTGIAERCGVPDGELHRLFEPGHHFKDPIIAEARSQAIAAVANMRVGGRHKWTIEKVCEWFGVARNSIYRHRRKVGNFKPRQKRGL